MGAPAIRALFLDLGGVLLTNGWDRGSRRRAARTFGLDAEEMDERHHLTFGTYEEGKISLDDYLDRVVFYRERPFTRREFSTFMLDQSQPYPEMIGLIGGLKADHRLKVGVVSNEGRELILHRIQRFGLEAFVDFFVVSCFVHCRKPDRDIYRLALDLGQIPAAEVAYIEDREMFVEVGRSLGLQGIHHTGLESTRARLAELGLTVAGQPSPLAGAAPPDVASH